MKAMLAFVGSRKGRSGARDTTVYVCNIRRGSRLEWVARG